MLLTHLHSSPSTSQTPPTGSDRHSLQSPTPEGRLLGDGPARLAHSCTRSRYLCREGWNSKTAPMPITGKGEGGRAAKPHWLKHPLILPAVRGERAPAPGASCGQAPGKGR